MIDRRKFTLGLGALALTGVAGHGGGALAALVKPSLRARGPLYAAARRESDGAFAAAIFDLAGHDVDRVELPARGHDIAAHPTARECVAYARRPGRFAVAFGPGRNAPPLWFEAAKGRHFYGHGAYSHDGRLLFSTENDYENARGAISVRDRAAGFRQIGEFDAGGIGPHDAVLLPDGRTLAIGNGGLATHPQSGRQPLNLSTMRPSLAYLDLAHGDIDETVTLDAQWRQLSVRHVAAVKDMVVFGCQYHGDPTDRPPLAGLHRRGGKMALFDMPGDVLARMKNYIGAVAIDAGGEIAAASSPRGGIVAYWSLPSGRYLGFRALADACGLAPAPAHKGFILTSGQGDFATDAPASGKPFAPAHMAVAWDNHITPLA